MRDLSIHLTILLFAMLLLLGGCFSSDPKNIEAFMRPGKAIVTTDYYILQPPDEIEIHCLKAPELDKQRQQIRPDGMVSFEGVGEVKAAGKTPKELQVYLKLKIIALYTLSGEDPIDVRVVAFKSKLIYIEGQVYNPGPYEYTGRDLASRLISKARPTNSAWLDRIQIVRPSSDPNVKPQVFELNYFKLIQDGEAGTNVLLNEGDIVYVPPTVLGWIGLKVSELLSPINQAFSTYNLSQMGAYYGTH